MVVDDRVPVASSGDEVIVRDIETLRVISDPLRMKMLDLMNRGEWTAKQVAAALGVGQTRLYHHIALLEAHGLLRVTGTRLVSGIVEKRYTAPASRVSVDPRLFLSDGDAPGQVAQAVDGLVASAFAAARREIGESIEAGMIDLLSQSKEDRGVTITLDSVRLSRSAALALRTRVEELVAEFARADLTATADESDVSPDATTDDEQSDAADYGLLVAFYREAPKPRNEGAGPQL